MLRTLALTLLVEEVQLKIRVLVLEHIVDGIDVVISMETIYKPGRVTINRNQVKFGKLEAIERFKCLTSSKFRKMLSATSL